MDSHTSTHAEDSETAALLQSARETVLRQQMERGEYSSPTDTSPLRHVLREYFSKYPNVTAARVGPQGDDL